MFFEGLESFGNLGFYLLGYLFVRFILGGFVFCKVYDGLMIFILGLVVKGRVGKDYCVLNMDFVFLDMVKGSRDYFFFVILIR